MIIKHAHIEKFRALEGVDFDLGSKLTAIVGHNGTMKTSVLGILSQTFTISNGHVMHGVKTIDGYNFHSQFREKFKLSERDVPGEHLWKLELYPGVYKVDYFEAHSIERDKKTNIPRFWSTEGKGQGTGYPQIPAYYISLKRVTPIGEENKFNYVSELTDDEQKFLIDEYKDIFSLVDSNNISVDSIYSSNKHTASIHEKEHDALAISAGQDNLGKLLIAVLSFRRLKKQYPVEYKGGLLLIDEIESTFHPAAQARLIKRMYKYAKEFKIQFVYTTHSPTVIKQTFFDKYNPKEAQMLYLKKVGNKVVGFNNPKIENVVAELSGEVVKVPKKKYQKIEVFTEDDVARQIISNWLNSFRKYIHINNCSIGAEAYLELCRVGLNAVKDAVIILDGDKDTVAVNNKIKKYAANNIIFLPKEKMCPEKMFYAFLMSLEERDAFWDNSPGGYDKTKCFSNHIDLLGKDADSNQYKAWFKENEKYWERGNKKLYDYWKICCKAEYDTFVDSFKNAYNKIALVCNGEIIV